MGAFLPSVAMSALQLGLDAAQQKRQAEIERKMQETKSQSQIQSIRQAYEEKNKQRQDVVRRALAAQKARFGSQGVGMDGSSENMLSSIVNKAKEEDIVDKNDMLRRIKDVNVVNEWSKHKDLLELSAPTYRSAFNLIQKGLRKTRLIDF
jgi:mannitol-specific phosphotransferase system IIBC component